MVIPCLGIMKWWYICLVINGEELFECVEHPHYYVTKSGKIYSSYQIGGRGVYGLQYIHELRASSDKDGYLRVVLCNNGNKTYENIHSLVAQQFIGDIASPYVINHIDGNKINNAIDNLEIVTVKENTEHAHKNGLIKRDIKVIVECKTGDVLLFNSMAECCENIQDISIHYLKQIRDGIIQYSMVYFEKYDTHSRISKIQSFYNGKPYLMFDTMQECDAHFNMKRGSTSSAIKNNHYRQKVNQYHIVFPNVSTIENSESI